MTWFQNIESILDKNKNYSHRDLVGILRQKRPNLSYNAYSVAINSMLKSGSIIRNGYNSYSIPNGNEKAEYKPTYSDASLKLINIISQKYPEVQFTVFETVLMNEFLNHLIAQNMIFIQAEKELSIFIFRYLQETNVKKLMYKPGIKELNLYWESGSVVVTDLVSEAPLNRDIPHHIRLEKMLVDICADKLISTTYSKAELPDIFSQAQKRYKLDTTKLLRYARRRNREDYIKKLLEGRKEI